MLGDSLSAAHNLARESGWVHLLKVRLGEQKLPWRIVNASISGETTAAGLARLPDLLATTKPNLLVLELGANDALRGLPLAEIRANLAAMLAMAEDANAELVLLGIEMPVNYGPRYRDGLRAIYRDLATEYDAALLPFLLDGVALDSGLMLADGLHPNAAGQKVVLENVWGVLQPILE